MRSGKALKVLLSGGFSLLMKMDSKIRNSVVFLDVPIIWKWSELIYWLLLQITAWSLILDWGGLERGWPVR